eukprot:scaffold7761_cov286-Pinguiococcus_pyrenoidosus.AAC.3
MPVGASQPDLQNAGQGRLKRLCFFSLICTGLGVHSGVSAVPERLRDHPRAGLGLLVSSELLSSRRCVPQEGPDRPAARAPAPVSAPGPHLHPEGE